MAEDLLQYITLMANYLSRMKTYPYLDAVNYVKMCMLFRDGDKDNSFSRKHVFASWFFSILLCFSGSVVSNFLAGEPTITPFKYQENLVIASIIWYLINYFPKDLLYTLFKIPMVEIITTCVWNVYVVNKIQSGVNYGIKHFPDAYIVTTVLGMAKGSGHVYVVAFIKLIKETFVETDNEFLYPSLQSKCSFISSLLFVLSHFYQFPGYNQPFVFVVSLLLFIHSSVSNLAFGSNNMFAPMETLLCRALFHYAPEAAQRSEQSNPTTDDVSSVNSEVINSSGHHNTGYYDKLGDDKYGADGGDEICEGSYCGGDGKEDGDEDDDENETAKQR